jgi:hypothetical protein
VNKYNRYPPNQNPHASLHPFVVEDLGRLSETALHLLRATAPEGQGQRTQFLQKAFQELSIVTQTRLAEILISAEMPAPPK